MAEPGDPPSRLLDPARLAAVQVTGLLDTDPEPVFDDLAWMAARLLDAPLALITVVDDRRSYRKSYVGSAAIPPPARAPDGVVGSDGVQVHTTIMSPAPTDPLHRTTRPGRAGTSQLSHLSQLATMETALRECPVEESFCRYVIGSAAPVVVGRGHPAPADGAQLSIGGTVIRSWVGYPVMSTDGQVIGAFAVADPQLREWTETELEALRTLTRSVSTEIAGRQLAGRARASRRQSLELSGQAQQLRQQNLALVSAVRQSLVPAGRWSIGPLDVAVSLVAGIGPTAAATDFVDVGGVGSGRWGVTLGHVHDRSVQAAATAAFARQELRAHAGLDSPGGALRATDHAVFDRDPFGPSVSCTSLWLGPDGGRLAIQASGAGDLVPAVRAADGRLRWIGMPSSPLGHEIGPHRPVHRDELGPGEALVLVNPAVLSATGPGRQEPFGPDRLAGVLRVTGSQGPGEVAAAVTAAAAEHAGENRPDDLVVLVAQPQTGWGR